LWVNLAQATCRRRCLVVLSFVKFVIAKAALYKGLNRMFFHSLRFYPIWKKGEARIVHKNILKLRFLNIGTVNAIRFRSAKGISVRSLRIYFTVGMRFGINNLNLIPLSSCEFHENRRKERRGFLRGINKFIFTPVRRNRATFCKKRRIDKFCKLVHGVCNLQSWSSLH